MKEADKLRDEAKMLLRQCLKIPHNDLDTVDRIIDCIIGAAIIEVASLQGNALQTIKKAYKT